MTGNLPEPEIPDVRSRFAPVRSRTDSVVEPGFSVVACSLFRACSRLPFGHTVSLDIPPKEPAETTHEADKPDHCGSEKDQRLVRLVQFTFVKLACGSGGSQVV